MNELSNGSQIFLFYWLVIGTIIGAFIAIPLSMYLKDQDGKFKNKHAVLIRLFTLFFPIVALVGYVLILTLMIFISLTKLNIYTKIVTWLNKPWESEDDTQ